ncbi:multiheme c-type cytochrome [Puia sp.]|uniref:multiheme c-type cytochrome n=1 Tax=Puia sp. TaxID=2045100 RepID=UPI002F427417
MLKKIRYSTLIIAGLLASACLFVTCVENEQHQPKAPESQVTEDHYKEFAGSAACAGCHRDIYQNHLKTAHYLTTRHADSSNILGSTTPPQNSFYFNPSVYLAVEKRDSLTYQVEYVNGAEQNRAPLNITVGSGKRGQTFLYWYHDKLLQLPLTYFTELHQWTNSPGFSNRVIFRRPATSRCLECHSTYFRVTSAAGAEPEDFSHTQIVYGVDCEKCHGPAARHVAFHQANPTEKTARFIINPRNFSRAQSLDLCRLCHGGRLSKSKPSFTFQAGDRLANFFALDTTAKSAADLDVHGNQYGKLASSKCFAMSQMTCLSCHSPHENETGKTQLFSQRCMTCHNEQHGTFCKAKDRVGPAIKTNCIDCHMPEERSRSIMVLLQGQNIPTAATMRSHFISIYPDATKAFLNKTRRK